MKSRLMNYILGFDPALPGDDRTVIIGRGRPKHPKLTVIELRCQNCWKGDPVYILVKNTADLDRLLENHNGHDFEAGDMPPAAGEVV